MQVAPPPSPPPADLNFESSCSSPYLTAPSSPNRLAGSFFTAPNSPRLASYLSLLASGGSAAAGASPHADPKSEMNGGDDEDCDVEEGFEFEFSGQLDRNLALSADELFSGGKIKPLKMSHAVDLDDSKKISNQFPEKTQKETESRAEEKQSVRKWENRREAEQKQCRRQSENRVEAEDKQRHQRGREKLAAPSPWPSNPVRKGSRSLSPFRGSDFLYEREEFPRFGNSNRKPSSPSPSSSANSTSSVSSAMAAAAAGSKGSKKWSLKDLLLFRSASEGRAPTGGKDTLRKYYAPLARLSKKKREEEDLKTASFRSAESSFRSTEGSVSGSNRMRRAGPGSVSAHELHYKTNRAASEEMRRKTFLPYKQDLLGCLGFNSVGISGGVHEISRGFGSLTRG